MGALAEISLVVVANLVSVAGQLQQERKIGKVVGAGRSLHTHVLPSSRYSQVCWCYGNPGEIPLFPLDPITAVWLPERQAEFCKEALKSLSYFYGGTSQPL